MIEPSCIEETDVSKIKVKDGTKFAVFLNSANTLHLKVRVDGCAVMDGPRADWVVERGNDAIVVELKGRDVEHAAVQIAATSTLWKNVEGRCGKIAGLIVARQYPKASTVIQLKQRSFVKTFGGPLHVVNHCPEVYFDHVLSFRGPFKA